MSRTMLCNAALMVRLLNFYSSFKPNFFPIFCSSFKLFENQTVLTFEGQLYIIAG